MSELEPDTASMWERVRLAAAWQWLLDPEYRAECEKKARVYEERGTCAALGWRRAA